MLLQNAYQATFGNTVVSDATVTGTVERIIGSDDEKGTAVFKALASGTRRMDLSLSSGQYSEIRNLAPPPAGVWSGPDQTSHPIAFHNLLSEPVWFFAALAIVPALNSAGYTAVYVGHETHLAQAVEHVSLFQISPVPAVPGGVSHEHLTNIDFYLDSSTFLPVAMAFNIHPDKNALLDIPVEVRFGDYRSAGAVKAAYHVQEYVNNSLVMDLQVGSVAVNTGISSSQFSIQ